MGNIIDYIKQYGNETFEERAFNEVDALILSQFAYFKWEHVIPEMLKNEEGLTIEEMKEKMFDAEVFSYEIYAEDNRALWEAMINSKRFSGMKCNYLSVVLSEAVQTQFCAFAVFPNGALPVVLFRGTDETILGWKEDYNMAQAGPVTGQRLASLYLKQFALRISGDFIVAGHSKGGNLAVYSVLSNGEDIQKRVQAFYCFDGPHFNQEILDEYNFDKIVAKQHKYIPQSSVVGILLETDHNYRVVKSVAHTGVKQHDPFSWVVKDGAFEFKNDVSKKSLQLNETMIDLITKLDNDQIVFLGNILFSLVQFGDATTTTELIKDKKGTTQSMIEALKNVSEEVKDEMKDILNEII